MGGLLRRRMMMQRKKEEIVMEITYLTTSDNQNISIPSTTAMAMRIDGVVVQKTTTYRVPTAGSHKVELIYSTTDNILYNDMFSSNSLVSGLVIPEGVVEIPVRFAIHASFTDIYIPKSVETINANAFAQMSAMFNDGYLELDNITHMYATCLQPAYGQVIKVGNRMTYYGEGTTYQEAPLSRFYGTLDLSESVVRMSPNSIDRAKNLTLILRANSVVDISAGSPFFQTNNLMIYVPSELVDTYKANAQWSSYANKIFSIDTL